MPLAIKKSISSYQYTAQFVLHRLEDAKTFMLSTDKPRGEEGHDGKQNRDCRHYTVE
ncbi:Uncharacterised protein [Serratia proteamaculans]|nr:Uncharacterised protein [Serratia proteamaculans]